MSSDKGGVSAFLMMTKKSEPETIVLIELLYWQTKCQQSSPRRLDFKQTDIKE